MKPVKYLNNKDLMIQVKLSKADGEMNAELAKMLMMLAERYGRSGKFVGYTFNEDMVGFAIMMLVRTWDRFDPEKYNNPFAYYTQCVHNSFLQFLNKEKTQREVRDKILVCAGLEPSFNYTEAHKDDEVAVKAVKEGVVEMVVMSDDI
jgi:DNA-directed RNA polymerase specialized sigma subunit